MRSRREYSLTNKRQLDKVPNQLDSRRTRSGGIIDLNLYLLSCIVQESCPAEVSLIDNEPSDRRVPITLSANFEQSQKQLLMSGFQNI